MMSQMHAAQTLNTQTWPSVHLGSGIWLASFMNDKEQRILATIKSVVDTLSPNGETYTPEELAQAFAERIIELEDLYEANHG